jgi:23S rRNA pseudouridine1911/1915/1917 synthase
LDRTDTAPASAGDETAMERVLLSAEIPATLAGSRVDQALAALFTDYSRARLQQWIRAGQVTVDGRVPRPRDPVAGHETVRVDALVEAHQPCRPQAIPLDIVYEDPQLMVVNKPAGLVVHPAAGNADGTLQNALLHHAPALAVLPRAGIVHRLDKDTSGLMVVARTLASHKSLVAQLAARTVKREYEAVANGVMTAGGSVDAPIGRHPVDRKRMAVVDSGKPSVTHYRVVERFRAHTWLRVTLETGRTHQIRVHLAHIRHPLVGDPVYSGRLRLPPSSAEVLTRALRGFRRQALHAGRLALEHPATGERLEWQVPLPADMHELLAVLRQDRDLHEQD